MLKAQTAFSVSKKTLIISALIIMALVIYLNRSYAHIFDYDKNRAILTTNMQRTYTLEGEGKNNIKYVALGDSLTYGFGASNFKGTFPFTLAQKLLNKYKKVEVINLGVSGATSEDLVRFQLPKAIEEKPDLVTLMIGTNDVHDFVDTETFRVSLENIIVQLKNTQAQILVINIPYLGTDSLVLPPYNKIMDLRIKQFNKIIREVAEEKQVKYVDLYSKSNKIFKKNQKLYYSIDQFHPSDSGYILWGNLIDAD